jgi:hypothetical protein
MKGREEIDRELGQREKESDLEGKQTDTERETNRRRKKKTGADRYTDREGHIQMWRD